MAVRVEVLTFSGCPHAEEAIRLACEVAAELDLDAKVEVVDVPDLETAARLRFPGSPTIRVDGRDVEDGAEDREGGGVLSCRVYTSENGEATGVPPREWVRAALERGRRD